MKRQPWVALTATAAVLAIVGAACGTSEPSDAEPEATTTTVVAEEAAPEPSIVTPPHEDDLETLLEDLIAGTELPALGVTVFDSQGVIESGVTGVRRVGDPTLVALTDKSPPPPSPSRRPSAQHPAFWKNCQARNPTSPPTVRVISIAMSGVSGAPKLLDMLATGDGPSGKLSSPQILRGDQ